MKICLLNKYKSNFNVYIIMMYIIPNVEQRKIYIINQLCYNEFKRFGNKFIDLCNKVNKTMEDFYDETMYIK